MDSTEAQLRFGASLTNSSDPTHPSHPLHTNASRCDRARIVGFAAEGRTREREGMLMFVPQNLFLMKRYKLNSSKL